MNSLCALTIELQRHLTDAIGDLMRLDVCTSCDQDSGHAKLTCMFGLYKFLTNTIAHFLKDLANNTQRPL